MQPLVIFGATNLAKLVRHYAEELGGSVAAFVVDDAFKTSDVMDGVPIISWSEAQARFKPGSAPWFVAVGYKSMHQRAAAYERVKEAGHDCVSLVCPSAYLARGVVPGDNTIIMPGAVIEPNVTLGDNNVVWSHVTICHDSVIGDHNFFAANATIGGHVSVGQRNFFGFSSTVQQRVAIGNDTLVGAQSLVRSDTRDLHAYWGSPAAAKKTFDKKTGITLDA